jgi:hypothetical protein
VGLVHGSAGRASNRGKPKKVRRKMDGSFHEWLEGRGPRGFLMNLVEDSTWTTLCRLGEQETIWAAAGVLLAWMKKYGVPGALYTDWKNVLCARANSQGDTTRNTRPDAVWPHVPTAGNQYHRSWFA